MVALGDVAEIDRVGVDPATLAPETHYLGLEHIERGGRIIGCGTVSGAGLTSTKFKFTTEHVLYGKLRPNLGKVSRPTSNGVCSTDILPIRPGERLDRDYLAHYLVQPGMVRFAASQATGANLPRLKPSTLANFHVPLPTLEEQRRIAAILDHADALRTKRRQVLDHLDALTQSSFHDMFNEPFPTVPLGELADTRLGKMLDAKRQTGEHRRPYLRNANVQWFRLDLTDLFEMDFDAKDREAFALEPGDVLVCEGGQPGRSAIWRGELENCYFQKAVHRVRLGGALKPEYFVRAMKRIVDSNGLKDFVTSSTISHLTGEKLRTLPFPVPPLGIQKDFATLVERIHAQQVAVERALAAVDELFASLQSRAFRGEL